MNVIVEATVTTAMLIRIVLDKSPSPSVNSIVPKTTKIKRGKTTKRRYIELLL